MIEEQDDSSWCNSQKTFIRLNLQVRCTVLLGEDGSPLQCFNHPLKPPPQKPTQFLKKSAFHMRIPNPKIRAFAKLTNPQICWRIQQKNAGDKNPHSILTTLPLSAVFVASFSLRQMATAHFGKLPTLVQVSVPWFFFSPGSPWVLGYHFLLSGWWHAEFHHVFQ